MAGAKLMRGTAMTQASIKVGMIAKTPFVHGLRQRQCGEDGDRRHQRERRPAGAEARSLSRGRRDDRQRCGGRGDEARPAGQGRCALRRHLQLDAAGHQGPRRRRGQDALPLSRAIRRPGMRPADLLHRPGAGAAARSAHSVADAEERREEILSAVGRLHLAARHEQEGP